MNARIIDRSNVFYWQTDRRISIGEARTIWSDRHKGFGDSEIVKRVNDSLDGSRLAGIEPFDKESQTNLGNVNHVRIGRLDSGAEVVIRSHPMGVPNGYFHAESEAAAEAKKAGLPSYSTYALHDLESGDDFAFQVCEKLPGTAIKPWLDSHPNDEGLLLFKIGEAMARMHAIKVEGFGPFDNKVAAAGKLQGLHRTFAEAVRASLHDNTLFLQGEGVFTEAQADEIMGLFSDSSPALDCRTPVLVHNDFADWNLLTDGKEVTGILDWDECVGGDPVSDIACWSTFFDPSRLEGMLKGYWSVAERPDDFERRFQLLRFRYTISKMTLRMRRYNWDPADAVRERIEIGKKHLAVSMKVLGIG